MVAGRDAPGDRRAPDRGMTVTDGTRRLAGRYRLDGSLGRGGMSEVFRGYDERLDRRVAIKLLRSRSPGSIRPLLADSFGATRPTPATSTRKSTGLRPARSTGHIRDK